MSKGKPKRSAQQRDLVRLIDDTLMVLSARGPDGAVPLLSPPAPLPSLLERCEALLERSITAHEPIRIIHCFGDGIGLAELVDRIPNLKRFELDKLFGPVPNFVSPSLSAEMIGRAVLPLLDSFDGRGGRIVFWNDHGYGLSGMREMFAPLGQIRRTRGLVWVRHPLATYLVGHKRGVLSFRPASLENFSQRYLAFLEQTGDFPIVQEESALNAPSVTLRQVAKGLDISLPDWATTDREAPLNLDWAVSDEPNIRYGDGSPATEEPLDSPNYLVLCQRLGYDPLTFPKTLEETVEGPGRTKRLPQHRFDPSVFLNSQIASLLPVMTRLTKGPRVPVGSLTIEAILEIVEVCIADAEAFYERLDGYLPHVSARESALILIACACHFLAKNQKIHALGLLSEARDHMAIDDRELRLLGVEMFMRLNKPDLAMALLTEDAMQGPWQIDPAHQAGLAEALKKHASVGDQEHGHSLLIKFLEHTLPVPVARKRVMIEIGTTRERVPGQGSTEKLARLCLSMGIDFITVDMDPRNGHVANRMFRRNNLPFRAVTAKGEDFLAEWRGPIDYCFLDAYDFDHGNHSDLRQSRYETFLGSRIADEQCHKMHLDCVISLVEKLSEDGVICFDDTWTDPAGAWTAKGTTAMPYLLSHGFKVTLAANRAAMLARKL